MPAFIDVSGQTFGRLTAVRRVERRGKDSRFLCRCICGVETVVTLGNLRKGHTKSCGCANREATSAANSTHGLSKTRVYRIWSGMRNRCFNRNNKRFPYYGGRGISVCDRWSGFESFLEDMGFPEEGQSIDRIDPNGNYEPSNCRWVDMKTQCRNKRNNILIEYRGKIEVLHDVAKQLGVHSTTLNRRVKRLGVDAAIELCSRK